MEKKKNRAIIKTQNLLAERQFGVILEHLDKKMDTVLEGHAALDKKIDDFRYETRTEIGFLKLGQNVLSNHYKDLTVKVDKLSNSQEDLTVKVDKLGADNKSVFEYLSRMDDELASIRSDVAEIKAKISLVSAEKLAELERRVHAMEAKLASYKHMQ